MYDKSSKLIWEAYVGKGKDKERVYDVNHTDLKIALGTIKRHNPTATPNEVLALAANQFEVSEDDIIEVLTDRSKSGPRTSDTTYAKKLKQKDPNFAAVAALADAYLDDLANDNANDELLAKGQDTPREIEKRAQDQYKLDQDWEDSMYT